MVLWQVGYKMGNQFLQMIPRVQIYRIRDDWQEIYDPSDPDDIPEELRQDALN